MNPAGHLQIDPYLVSAHSCSNDIKRSFVSSLFVQRAELHESTFSSLLVKKRTNLAWSKLCIKKWSRPLSYSSMRGEGYFPHQMGLQHTWGGGGEGGVRLSSATLGKWPHGPSPWPSSKFACGWSWPQAKELPATTAGNDLLNSTQPASQ